MRKISADYIFPVSSPPIKFGVVTADDKGKIVSIAERSEYDEATLEIYNGIICPGFINAHCHLELSYMRGKIPDKKGMVQFIMDLVDYRNGFSLSDENGESTDAIETEIRFAEEEMRRNGIVAIGDISNDEYSFDAKAQSDLRYHTFVECFGFFPEKTAVYFNRALEVFRKARELKLSASITPHAPYSVPPDLFSKIFSFGENDPPLFSYHNQESAEESILFEKKDGDFLTLFNHFKIPVPDFFATHKNSLTSVLPYFPINNRALFVHNTYASRSDLDLIHSSLADAWFCFCPNANRYIENRLPDFSLFKNLDDCICIGTDSYASNYSLSILEELKTIQQHDPSISTDQLLRWSTLNGARFFKWEEELGSINPGKRPGLNLISGLDEALNFTPQSTVQHLY